MRDFRNELKQLREAHNRSWESYSLPLRKEAGEALLELHQKGSTISELCAIYGTKDRGTVIDLLRLADGYEPRERGPRKKQPKQSKQWDEGETFFITWDGTKKTIRVPNPRDLEWLSKKPRSNDELVATWDDGLFVSGSRELHAELLAGNKELQ